METCTMWNKMIEIMKQDIKGYGMYGTDFPGFCSGYGGKRIGRTRTSCQSLCFR